METRSNPTRAAAWLAAARLLYDKGDRLYNLIVEIQRPDLATPQSRAIEARVDHFLKTHGSQPIHTVAETIFPATEYRSGGLLKVYDYPNSIYPGIKSVSANSRGTYALRLVQRTLSDGTHFNPLEYAIHKLRKQIDSGHPQRAVYELDLDMEALELKFYDTEIDHSNVRGGQCLSHVSLKLGPSRELYLTALYRYQYFVQKALGNFKGLARLQACIAKEVGIPIGPLVCHATLAILEDDHFDAPWKRAELLKLIEDCEAIASSPSTEVAA
jgi:hypothetical protein